MYHGGIARFKASVKRAEEAGEAARNPYAASVYREFIIPVANAIREDITAKRVGARQAHVQLLLPLDPEAVAFLAVRSALNSLLHGTDSKGVRTIGYAIGTAVHNELVLAQIDTENPDLFHALSQDFGRKRTKNVRHRMTVYKMQAEKNGISWAEWGVGSREQVGMYLLELLSRVGMIDIDQQPTDADGKRLRAAVHNMLHVHLAPDVRDALTELTDLMAVTNPVYGPCVEPPRDWTNFWDGGFHTAEMRRVHRGLVKVRGYARELVEDTPMPIVLAAVNALQRTAWAVNTRVLDVVRQCGDFGEVVTAAEKPKPPVPQWLGSGVSKEDMSPEEMREFLTWKSAMRDWHLDRRLRGAKAGRYYSATRIGQAFRDCPALYFVYFADSRGRLYPLTYGLNPQGSDLQKALLHFAVGKPLHTEEARRWFLIQGANKWGFDKAALDDRVAWHEDKHELLMAIASDPVNNLEWQKADCPLQFLAWCLEYADWKIDPYGFESRLPISMDGSCNGLQHFSAMLRDKVGGQAVNLTANTVMEDIYRRVAERAAARMTADPGLNELGKRWLAHGISRSVVKRAVMTTPYGVTKRSAVMYVIEDYLKTGAAPCFEPLEYYAAAQTLMNYAWPAIGDVVVKAREAMDWLKQAATAILKQDKEREIISWVTPSGFVSTQAYYDVEEHRIRTRLHGEIKLMVHTESDEPSTSMHSSGLAPNFVHSMDAAHLHITSAAAKDAGIDSLAMIHDDYGTHAADAETLYKLIRSTFVHMYERFDPIMDFADVYPCAGSPPAKGELQLDEVLRSHFFFS
jgi:DNA-directed RNA polymerase